MSLRHNPYIQATVGGLAVLGLNVLAGVVFLLLVLAIRVIRG